jgi:hypothetical protein
MLMTLRIVYFSMMALLIVSCSSTKVLNTEAGDGANLNSYKTFDFYKVEAKGDTASQLYAERIAMLEDAIAIQLQKHGYLLSKTNPDLLVNIGVVVNQQVQTRQTDFRTDAPRYTGQRRYSWKSEEVEVGTYREGTVTVHLVDRKANKMVWKGAVQDVIPKKESKVQKTISNGIKKLFGNYPGSARKEA